MALGPVPDRQQDERAFPGTWLSLALVAAIVVAEVLAGAVLRRVALSDNAAVDALLATLLGNVAVIAFFLRARGLFARNVAHPTASSPVAVAGMLSLPVLLVTPAVFLAGCVVDDAIVAVFPMSDWMRRAFEELLAGGVPTYVLMVVVAPVLEEFVFRGIILRGLLARMPVGRAIVMSSLIFGAAHFNVYQFVGAGLLGLPLGWLYARFRSTIPCILLHAFENLLVLVVASSLGVDAKAVEIPVVFWIVAALACWPGIRMLAKFARA